MGKGREGKSKFEWEREGDRFTLKRRRIAFGNVRSSRICRRRHRVTRSSDLFRRESYQRIEENDKAAVHCKGSGPVSLNSGRALLLRDLSQDSFEASRVHRVRTRRTEALPDAA